MPIARVERDKSVCRQLARDVDECTPSKRTNGRHTFLGGRADTDPPTVPCDKIRSPPRVSLQFFAIELTSRAHVQTRLHRALRSSSLQAREQPRRTHLNTCGVAVCSEKMKHLASVLIHFKIPYNQAQRQKDRHPKENRPTRRACSSPEAVPEEAPRRFRLGVVSRRWGRTPEDLSGSLQLSAAWWG